MHNKPTLTQDIHISGDRRLVIYQKQQKGEVIIRNVEDVLENLSKLALGLAL